MAPPPDSLRAHDGRGSLLCEPQQLPDSVLKASRQHVIGIAAERRMPPAAVHRVRQRLAKTAQRRTVTIGLSDRREKALQRFAAEMRMAPRFGHGADVCEVSDVVNAQEIEENFSCARRVADGPDPSRGHKSV